MFERPPHPPLDRGDAVVLAAGLLAVAVFVASELRIAEASGLPLDDSWIHLRFSRHRASA